MAEKEDIDGVPVDTVKGEGGSEGCSINETTKAGLSSEAKEEPQKNLNGPEEINQAFIRMLQFDSAALLNGFPDFGLYNGTRTDPGCFLIPAFFPMPIPAGQYQAAAAEQNIQQGGLFAVPMIPSISPSLPGMIPFPYGGPLGAAPRDTQHSPSNAAASEGLPANQAPLAAQENNIGAALAARGARPNGQARRILRIGFEIDLLLIIKLAVVIFFFNQDGSKDRFFLLLCLAGLVYLYQTGALTPFLRWVSLSAQRAMTPPQQRIQQPMQQPPQPAANNVPTNPGGNETPNVQAAGPSSHASTEDQASGAAQDQNGNLVQDAAEIAEPQQIQQPNWWGFIKEIQMIVVGFFTSLLPGYQHLD